MRRDYWRNKIVSLERSAVLVFYLPLIFNLRNVIVKKWPLGGMSLLARLPLKAIPYVLALILFAWTQWLEKRELERKGIDDARLFAPEGIVADLQVLVLIARANARVPHRSLVRAFDRASKAWRKRYAEALSLQFGSLGFRMSTRIEHQVFLLEGSFADLHFDMIKSNGEGRRKSAERLSTLHDELCAGFGIWAQSEETRVTLLDYLKMDWGARVGLLGVAALLVWKADWRVPALFCGVALLFFFGHQKTLEKAQESVLDKANLFK